MFRPRTFVAAGGVITAGFIAYEFGFPPRTAAVRSMEDRYTSSGGAADHLPATASPRGNSNDSNGRHVKLPGHDVEDYQQSAKEQRLSYVYCLFDYTSACAT